jgi:very-short-patch-repair endonuclease
MRTDPYSQLVDQVAAQVRAEIGMFLSGEGWKKLVVECDGHDFHERTKLQAARDRARDRRSQHDGIPVFRFTGSELWADAWGRAREVIEFVGKGLL